MGIIFSKIECYFNQMYSNQNYNIVEENNDFEEKNDFEYNYDYDYDYDEKKNVNESKYKYKSNINYYNKKIKSLINLS